MWHRSVKQEHWLLSRVNIRTILLLDHSSGSIVIVDVSILILDDEEYHPRPSI